MSLAHRCIRESEALKRSYSLRPLLQQPREVRIVRQTISRQVKKFESVCYYVWNELQELFVDTRTTDIAQDFLASKFKIGARPASCVRLVCARNFVLCNPMLFENPDSFTTSRFESHISTTRYCGPVQFPMLFYCGKRHRRTCQIPPSEKESFPVVLFTFLHCSV